MAKRGLGRGIDALMNAQEIDEPTDSGEAIQPGVQKVALSSLVPNPHQPRTSFSDEALDELAESIRNRGVIQPILVERGSNNRYTIIAGERRVRAAEKAGLTEVPVILQTFSDAEKREIALVENIQRENLSPIDEAQAYHDIMESAGIGQDELARRVGKNRSTVANALRLLKLPEAARAAVARGEVSAGHARALLSMRDPQNVSALLGEITDEGLSVRAAEKRARELEPGAGGSGATGGAEDTAGTAGAAGADGAEWESAGTRRKGGVRGEESKGGPSKTPEMRDLEERLIEKLGTRVSITGSNERGRVEVFYYSSEDLESLYTLLSGESPPA